MNATEIEEMQKEYQEEIDDLKGMMALLAASLKRVSSKYGHNEEGMPSDWSAWVEAREFIAQVEDMLKGGE